MQVIAGWRHSRTMRFPDLADLLLSGRSRIRVAVGGAYSVHTVSPLTCINAGRESPMTQATAGIFKIPQNPTTGPEQGRAARRTGEEDLTGDAEQLAVEGTRAFNEYQRTGPMPP